MNLVIKSILFTVITLSSAQISADEPVVLTMAPTAVEAATGTISVPQSESVAIAQSSSITTPPEWLANAMQTIEKMPIIGPIAVEFFKWLGVVSVIMTALVTCLLTITRTLFYAAKLGSIAGLMAWVTKFESGKIMNWLKFFSLYNAKKE